MARSADGGAPLERNGWPKAAVIVACVGVCVSITAWALTYSHQRSQLEDAFNAVADGVRNSLEQQMDEPIELMQSISALWISSHDVEREEFHHFAFQMRSAGVGARSVAWVSQVREADLAAFHARIHKELPDSVIAHEANGAPAAARQQHWLIEYEETADGNDKNVGLDLATDARTMDLFERARSAKAPQLRIDDTEDGAIVVAAAPVFSIIDTKDGPSEEFRGYAIGKCLLKELVETGINTSLEGNVAATIRDGSPDGPIVAEYGDAASKRSSPSKEVRATKEGVVLSVACAPTSRWIDEHESYLPWVLLIGGLGVSAGVGLTMRNLEMHGASLTKANAELYTEVAERHTVEMELRETQRKLETLVSNLPGLAYRCRNDEDWTMEFISDGCIPLTGFKPADFYSGKVSFGRRVIHADDRERVWDEVQRALDDRAPFRLEYRVVTAFGEQKWVWEQGRGVYSRAGELLALEGFIADITERRHAEDQLAKEKNFSEVIVASLPGNFYVFDELGRFIRWNDNVVRVTGYSHDELERMHPLDFFAPVDQPQIERAVKEVFEQGSTRVAADLLAKDGTRTPYYLTGVRFTWENANFLVGVGIDVGEQKRASDERAKFLASLLPTQKLESVGVLAGAIAHDFNNLLTVVLGNAGLAQRNLPANSPAQKFIEQAIGASRSASHLTRQLLDYADLEGRSRREIDLSEEIEEFSSLLRSSVPRSVTLEFELAPELPRIEADPAQLQQLTMNLVLNAAEAYDQNGGRVVVQTSREVVEPRTARATRGEPRPGPCVVLAVRDEGAGLDETTLARVGELFFTTKDEGRGLGLAAVLGILRAHGAWLHVASEPGHGSTFRAYFPVGKRASE